MVLILVQSFRKRPPQVRQRQPIAINRDVKK